MKNHEYDDFIELYLLFIPLIFIGTYIHLKVYHMDTFGERLFHHLLIAICAFSIATLLPDFLRKLVNRWLKLLSDKYFKSLSEIDSHDDSHSH